MDLVAFLEQAGYRRVPLSNNGVGHFHTAGSLNGRPVSVLIDTGASSTVVGLTLAREMGLELEKLGQKGGGAGGIHLDIFRVREAKLTLGDVTPRPHALFAVDLSHVNEGLALKGGRPVEVILGVDVFEAQSAVIDYGSSSLFLKE